MKHVFCRIHASDGAFDWLSALGLSRGAVRCLAPLIAILLVQYKDGGYCCRFPVNERTMAGWFVLVGALTPVFVCVLGA